MKPRVLPSLRFRRRSAAETRKYRRQLDGSDPEEESPKPSGDAEQSQNERKHREVSFAFLPDRYEPLVEDSARVEAEEEKKARKREQYKKVRKNVGKAFRASWKCLRLGLYSFARGYSIPVTVASAFVPDFHRGTNRD